MEDIFAPRALTLFAIGSCIVLSLILVYSFSGRTQVAFCDVGQGDAIYIRTRNGTDVLVDAGQSQDVLDCLGTHMPPFDRTIEFAVMTHPHYDHYGGFLDVMQRYSIKIMIMHPDPRAQAKSYQILMEQLDAKDVLIYPMKDHDRIAFDSERSMTTVWPTENFLNKGDGDPNVHSIVMHYQSPEVGILLTGDAPPHVLYEIMLEHSELSDGIDILKVPHHGSDNGLTQEFLDFIDPDISVISVGKDNRYSHPSQSVLQMFDKAQRTYMRTDEKGTISYSFRPGEAFSRE